MAYDAIALEIFIASPSDVLPERGSVREAIAGWNAVYSRSENVVLMPVGWETHSSPELSGRPQQMVNDRLLAHADILVGIFWSRVGTPTGEAASGTIEEIERHMEAGKPVMLYFSNAPIPQDMIDDEQRKKLAEFKAWAQDKGLYHTYNTPEELRSLLRDHLPTAMRENSYVSSMLKSDGAASGVETQFGPPVAIPSSPARSVSDDGLRVLKAAAVGNGTVIVRRYLSGTVVSAGRQQFAGQGADSRTIARMTAAVSELSHLGLLEDRSGKGQLFRVTHQGYQAADALPDDFAGPA
ncbi:hypothetical protein FJ987_01005 [Mesorhizobium sp. CU2]|uniref:hypothetical protein n=1 Tax=unclassified Mesorhizobium TaxID=325217 RepID=UPI001129C303|nr:MULTISPECIES: hypothetical protein [unclassified Mesorhizobium]TPN80645.1 hypothetical protein FJ988_21420 [Mesorhizobium sp. CU3]TPO21855.1 hypothetical protein FJ987_01005 [Mesorhizobium sp. CU2]